MPDNLRRAPTVPVWHRIVIFVGRLVPCIQARSKARFRRTQGCGSNIVRDQHDSLYRTSDCTDGSRRHDRINGPHMWDIYDSATPTP
jgi:hypothetical protein